MTRSIVSVALVSLLFITAAFPQANLDTPGVVIRPQMALQGADPTNPTLPKGATVRVYGTTMGGNSLMTRITVANYSTKDVSSLEYGWRISSPTACSDSTLAARWGTATVEVNILPGTTVDLDTPESLSRQGSASDLAKEAFASRSPVVLITVGIVKVTFADGSTWADNEAIRTNNFDGGLYEKQNDCHAPTVRKMQDKKDATVNR
jgi:hypothetical protein